MLQALPAGTTTWQEVEISDDETLLERYGLRIPVLQRTDNGLELDWPFDTYALTEFLQP